MFHFVLLAALLLPQAIPRGAGPPMGQQEVSRMVRARGLFTEEQILENIQSRGIQFRLTEAMRRELKKDGASPAVMAALEKAADALKRRTSVEAAEAAAAVAPPDVPPPPPLAPAEQQKLLDEVRQNALEYTEKLPNFICVQVTKRYVRLGERDDWRTQDVIQTRLAYNDRQESYRVISINDQMTDRPYDSLGGASSTGEFGSLLHALFRPETAARFEWVGPASLRGRPVYEYDYAVAKERSTWTISFQRVLTVVPAYRGRIAVDAENKQLLRLSIEAVNLPSDFPIRSAATTLDYDYAPISGRSFLLPMRATMEMRESGLATRNEIQFRQYRRFTADTKLVFEDEPAEKPPPQPTPSPKP